MRMYKSVVRNLILLSVLVTLPVFLSGKIGALGADCSDGCNDFIPSYGWEYSCQSGTYCCTGGGCPSFGCTQAGFTAKICSGYWTCCSNTDTNCTMCNTEIAYSETWGTCDSCGSSGGGGGSTTTYGTVIGRVVSDLNFDGNIATTEMWANNASTCASLKNDAFNFVYSGSNILNQWSCNPGAYYRTNGIVTGSGRSIQLTGVPTSLGYDCSRIRWEFGNTTNSSYNRSGNGCTASDLTITENETQHLWFFMTPNRPPVLSLSSPINYAGNTSYKIKPGVTERESGGTLNIRISSTIGSVNPVTEALWINAYGTPSDGIYPIVRVYGWNKSTGVRTYINQFTVTGVSQGYLVFVGSIYGFFDIEFTNDGGNAAGEDRNLYLGQVEFIDSLLAPGAYYFTVTPSVASDAALIQLDRGDPDDGYDVVNPPIAGVGGGYVGMYWSGSVRYPFMWYSPNTPLSGNITLTATDIYGASAAGTIVLNPLFRQLSGYLWKIDYSDINTLTCNPDAGSKLADYPGLNVRATYDPNPTTNLSPQGDVSSAGDYLIQNVFGTIHEACLLGMNTTTSPYYRLVCQNNEKLSGMGMCSGFIDSNTSTNAILNLGLQLIEAKRWVTAYNGNISAGDIELRLPPLPPVRTDIIDPLSICGLTTYCASLPLPNFTHYVLGYPGTFAFPNTPASFIFTKESIEDVGSVSLSLTTTSGVTATALGEDFRSGYEEYLTSNIRVMVDEIVEAYKSGLLDGTSYSTLPTEPPATYTENGIELYEGESLSGYTYTVENGGIAFLVVPKKDDRVLKINSINSTDSGRIIIITDREVEIGEEVAGQVINSNLSSMDPQVEASILTTKDIYIKNYATNPAILGTLILEGPVISGGNVRVQRNFTSVENEKRPALLVKYNTKYVMSLNNLVVNNSIPIYLKHLFDFNLTIEEF